VADEERLPVTVCEEIRMRLRFGWWNTKLHGEHDTADEKPQFVARVLRRLLVDDEGAQCSVLGLCEVDHEFVESLVDLAALDRDEFDVWKPPLEEGRDGRGLALISRKTHVIAEYLVQRIVRVADSPHHAGTVFRVSAAGGVVAELVLCHWPAIGQGDQDHVPQARTRCAEVIRRQHEDHGEGSRVIIMGDLNAEPFDTALRDNLTSTRDLHRARSKQGLLYNLAWRWLARDRPFDGRDRSERPTGTHLYRSGVESRWRTYDQALVAGSFLRGAGWSLREDESCVWHDSKVLAGTRGALLSAMADHLPIIVTLEYLQTETEEQP
jgi:Endonuclease/Exonuclease/phosphatase family